MQVVSLAPVPVASLPWRVGDGPWMLSIICKLTLNLEPGEAVIAKRHDPIYERDRFPDDDGSASLYAPSDLVPARSLVDVMIVGSAYSPRSTATNNLSARLHIKGIDKTLHIEGTGRGFKSAPLGYEFAEASPHNPVGTEGQRRRASHFRRRRSERDEPGAHRAGLWPDRGALAKSARAAARSKRAQAERARRTLPASARLRSELLQRRAARSAAARAAAERRAVAGEPASRSSAAAHTASQRGTAGFRGTARLAPP